MEKYCNYNKFQALQNKGPELIKILLNASEEMEIIDDCYCYIVGSNANEPDVAYVFEVWEDENAHKQVLNSSIVKEMISKATPLLDTTYKPENTNLIIHGGKAQF